MKAMRSVFIPVTTLKSVLSLASCSSQYSLFDSIQSIFPYLCYSLEHLLIIFHIVNPVILCKSFLEICVQGFVWRICDSKYVDPVALEPAAEFPVCMGKLRGDKDEIQHY